MQEENQTHNASSGFRVALLSSAIAFTFFG